MHEKSILEDTISELSENTLLREQHLIKLKQDHKKFIEEVSVREEELNALIKNQEEHLRKANNEIENLRHEVLNLKRKPTTTKTTKTTQTASKYLADRYSQTEPAQQRSSHHKQSDSHDDRKRFC